MTPTGAWMPFYIGDYLADTAHLSTEEHGAYILLILHYWRSGPLLDDDRQLARICGLQPKRWQASAETIRAFFRVENGRLHHKRIDHELASAGRNIEQRRAAGK